jgi:hypothetical protein
VEYTNGVWTLRVFMPRPQGEIKDRRVFPPGMRWQDMGLFDMGLHYSITILFCPFCGQRL